MIFLCCKPRKFESGNMVAILREGKSLPVRYSAIECLLLSVSKNKRTMSTSSGKLGNITSRDCLTHLAPFCLRALERQRGFFGFDNS